MQPERARAQAALDAVEGCASGAEAWEALEARGLIESGAVSDARRTFGGWMVSYDRRASWRASEREPEGSSFPKRLAMNEPSPLTVGLAVALASDWAGARSAELCARAAWSAIRPWVRPHTTIEPPVCWRLGFGAGDGERGELWYPRVLASVFDRRELADVGEIRAALHERPARVAGDLTALEDAWCARVWANEQAACVAERAERDARVRDSGEGEQDPSAPVERELGLWNRWDFALAMPVRQRFWRRYGAEKPERGAPLPPLLALPNPFEPLLAVWNLGYAPISLDARAIVVEVSPLSTATFHK
jgi:hypothetical protein